MTEYTHDAKGRVLAIKDAYGHYRRFEYDPMDRVQRKLTKTASAAPMNMTRLEIW